MKSNFQLSTLNSQLSILLALLLPLAAPAFVPGVSTGDPEHDAWLFGELYSQHLDAPRRNPYSYGGSYLPKTSFGTYGTTDVVEVSADLRIFKFDNFLLGTIDLWGFGRAMGFIENPDMSSLPDALIEAGLDLGLAWRSEIGWSLEVRAAPGMYSDIAAPAFGCPLTLNLYFCADPTLSFQIGGTYRPGWGIPFMPNAGVAWQPVDEIRVEAGVPRSKLTLFGDYMISPFATFEWRNTTYGLSGKDEIPDNLTYEEMFLTAGISFCPMRTWSLTGEYGKFLHRHLNADVVEDSNIDLSRDSFFRVMLKSEF
ncbi:MAG: hypothetical protein FWG05_03565 [Kiritimatiellaeota bacterium]|nr:hypothetical protein [Kiritimatiellota bacterium]